LGELNEQRAYGVYFLGDAADEARHRLVLLATQRGLQRPKRSKVPEEKIAARKMAAAAFLDWEPLEVLLDIIEDPKQHSVGGAPQIVRLYQNGLSESFVGRDTEGVDYYSGRRVQPKERFDRRIAQFRNGTLDISFSDRSLPLDH
jgi:hypothetical protein